MIQFFEIHVPERARLLERLWEADEAAFKDLHQRSTREMSQLKRYESSKVYAPHRERLIESISKESHLFLLGFDYVDSEDEEDKSSIKQTVLGILSQALADGKSRTRVKLIQTVGSLEIYASRLDLWKNHREEIVEDALRRLLYGEEGWLEPGERIERIRSYRSKATQESSKLLEEECRLSEIAERFRRSTREAEKAPLLSETKGIIDDLYAWHLAGIEAQISDLRLAIEEMETRLKLWEEKGEELIEIKANRILSGIVTDDVMDF